MEDVKTSSPAPAPVQRLRAAASYPYYDFDDSLTVSRKMQETQGGSCTLDQLALWLDYKSTRSGTFISRVSAARQFGLITDTDAGLAVSERARAILSPVMPEDAVAAKADAFLSAELFSRVYDKYKGSSIPPRVGMRNLFTSAFGLSEDAGDRAVRVLFDSAKQTGMFSGNDETRLVRPGLAKPLAPPPAPAPSPPAAQPPRVDAANTPPPDAPRGQAGGGGGSGGGSVPPGVHTAIVGLLRELPPPGAEFPKKAKQRFVKAFLATLDFVYPSDDLDDTDPAQ